jgi:hypothetical protein
MEEMMASLESLEAAVERLALTASSLEQRLQAQDAEMGGRVERMVAVEDGTGYSGSAGWESRLAAMERSIGELRASFEMQAAELHATELRAAGQSVASPAAVGAGRRTLPASTANLLAKHGMSDSGVVEQGALDAALQSLPVEQRIAVKSQLLRAGLLG